MTTRSTVLAASALLGVASCLPAAAAGVDSDDFTFYASLASDYVFRGYSQTREYPAVQLGLDFEHQSGFFAGLWGSNVDFPPAGPFEDRREFEVNIYAGYGVELGRGWALSGTLVRYEYPGDEGAIDWDYSELSLALRYGSAALSLAYSDSALGSGSEGVAVELADSWPLPKNLELAAGVGFFDLDSPFLQDYYYWNVGLSRPFRRFTVTLGYFDTDRAGEYNWGKFAAARVVAGVTYRIH